MAASTKPLLDDGGTGADAAPGGTGADAAPEARGDLKSLYLVLFVIGEAGSAVAMKKMNYFARFPAALSLLIPILGLALYPVITLMSLITCKVKCRQVVPKRSTCGTIAFIGCLFSLHHMFLNVGASSKHVPGFLIGVLVKFVVPCSMLFNMRILKAKYFWNHKCALLFLFAGAFVASWASLEQTWFEAPVRDTGKQVFNMLLILLSAVPLALSFVYVEQILVKTDKDMFPVALWFYICIFQAIAAVVLRWPTHWLLMIEHIDSHRAGPVHGPLSLRAQMECYLIGANPADEPDSEMNCGRAFWCWYTFLGLSLVMNISMPLATKYAGNSLMFFVKSCTVPLQGIIFASSFFMGEHAVALNHSEVKALFIVVLGVCLFSCKDPGYPKHDEVMTA